jgi:hypothetical protein
MSTRDETWVPVESGNATRICTVSVGEFCGRKAVETLHVRATPAEPWSSFDRCASHPAKGWLPIIKRIHPHAETRIEAIPQ